MRLQTLVRDCLFLNWAMPVASLPPPPEPLRYEVHGSVAGGSADAIGGRVFVSAVLFRQEGLHLSSLPLPRLSYPQCNVRVYVLDGDDEPAVWFWRELVPAWVVPGARLIGGQPATPAAFAYPRPSRDPMSVSWSWDVRIGEQRLSVRAERGASAAVEPPLFPSWNGLVESLRHRTRGYALSGSGLQRVAATHPQVAVWPLRAEVTDASLVAAAAPGGRLSLPRLHSAWLCPEIPIVFDLAPMPRALALPNQVPAPG